MRHRMPTGEHRRLLGVELTARQLESFSSCEPSIIEAAKLPDWTHSGRLAWPPPTIPLSVVVAASMTPPPDPCFSADWASAREQDMARRGRSKRAGLRRRKRVRRRVGVHTRRVYDAKHLARVVACQQAGRYPGVYIAFSERSDRVAATVTHHSDCFRNSRSLSERKAMIRLSALIASVVALFVLGLRPLLTIWSNKRIGIATFATVVHKTRRAWCSR
jgi:hypothetical protein